MAKNPVTTKRKIFVLDTSVILYDHAAFQNFQEHDVAVPIQVLEELDNMKGGNETRNFEARSFIRLIDEMSRDNVINQWLALPGQGRGCFKIIMDDKPAIHDAEEIFGTGKFDHRILNSALVLQDRNPDKKVVLVSKDICLRLKAKALELPAEDYETGKVKNVEQLYSGSTELKEVPAELIEELKKTGSLPAGKLDLASSKGIHYYTIQNGGSSINAYYNPLEHALENMVERSVFRIRPKNHEQAFAIHALMSAEVKLVTIQGNAGTGKTLLAIASALEQRKEYRQIFITRPTVPLSNKDIGFLPGDAKSKVDPYMAPIWDNLRFIREQYAEDPKTQARIDAMVTNEKIVVAPLAFIRGRTFSKIFFIVDEAQNLTPHEVKTIISRAGENTKMVFVGDVYQIDTPYLDAESNGLSYLIDKAKNHPLHAHMTLQKGERSELANMANELL